MEGERGREAACSFGRHPPSRRAPCDRLRAGENEKGGGGRGKVGAVLRFPAPNPPTFLFVFFPATRMV